MGFINVEAIRQFLNMLSAQELGQMAFKVATLLNELQDALMKDRNPDLLIAYAEALAMMAEIDRILDELSPEELEKIINESNGVLV